MNSVRFARVFGAFVLLASTAGASIAQDAAADPLAAFPDSATVTSYDYPAPGSDAARAEMAERFGIDGLAPGKFRWSDEIPSSGAVKIVISLTDQLAFVYKADQLIGVTTISSGMKDHETPTGVFPILAKEKDHKSRKYDDAPMPYMQRINQYGVALHGGRLPGYPASHGCVRLPMAFAAKLFNLTSTGSNVVIEA